MKKTILALTLSVISISTNASQFVSLVKIEKSQAIKTVVEKVGEIEKNLTAWKNTGNEYDCIVLNPNVAQIPIDCKQDQERTKDIYSLYSDNSESFDETVIEKQTITTRKFIYYCDFHNIPYDEC
ncbi:TPA: hypothetical protein N2935_001552 [Vibrio parahaemolyticus]|uniref:hypothetical protein n=1 Tax=Vibrio parahaemolyticus TaxID=670 RepID=UPI001E4E2D2C|nr:hypothetical protein [Vibrio parahaemolyticus]HCE1956663.1 hypothetical protein [Vibrio parahaemolyticus]HCG5138592.1 hypothetical protein [Vibrio parahaemolyticus]HCG5942092.1 hypothetical protein [Vibrio parahaemolyticus]HCG7242735.1 hypothetical protein [Vibrio parahaemolyticus]HCG8113522.1 hypothetical protein [Vibrio parahaemolyticus]